MEEKLDKIIELLEDLSIKIDLMEITLDEIKNGEDEIKSKQKLSILDYSLKVSELRKK